MIGLITLYQRNYGSILQAFATKFFVESLGYSCELLEERFSQKIYAKIWRKILLVINVVRYPLFRKFLRKRKKVIKVDDLNPTKLTLKKMDDFVNSEFKIDKFYAGELNGMLLQTKYHYFIAGSDQIWNTTFSVDFFRFLQFAPRKKRIALAASFGISDIPKYNQNALRKALNGFDYISVREETGVEIVKKYSNAKVCRIADPTFIYDAVEWRTFAKNTVIPSQKYILVHFLNEPNFTAIESMNWLSKQLGLDIFAIGYKYDAFEHFKRFSFIDAGPWEYVSMIDNAEFVFTDSFHSSLFSINFNKRFFVFHRQYSVSKQLSRISDLLKRFKIENRLISNIDNLKDIYLDVLPDDTRECLKKERDAIRDYIKKSISGQVPQCFFNENGKK